MKLSVYKQTTLISSNKFLKDDYFSCKFFITKQHKINFNKLELELIEKTWHPSRFEKWCLDIEELRQLYNYLFIIKLLLI